MRRIFLLFALAVALAGGLVGCSSGERKITSTPTKRPVIATQAPVAKSSPTKASPTVVGAIAKEELAAKPYSDKNGYFTFLPPKSWTQKDFPTDPRSKIEFDGPDSVLIRITAQTSQGVISKNVVEETRRSSEAGAATLRKQFPGFSQSVKEGSFAGLRAAIVVQTVPGQLEQELTVFVAGNIHFSIAYTALGRSGWEKHEKVARESLATLAFSEKINLPKDEVGVREEAVARAIRLAQLLTKMGNFSGAEEQILLALKKYPDEKRLNDALKLIKEKKVIPDNF